MRNFLLAGLLLGLLFSCKEKETEITQPYDPPIAFDYLPMKTGNYWVYRHYNIDTLGNVFETNQIDSVVITGDTSINGNRYFVFQGTNYPYLTTWGIVDILRDSSGYIVNKDGLIKFSETNFTDILASKTELHNGDTLYTLNYRMENPDTTITVPAGTFGVLNYKGTVYSPLYGPEMPNPRYLNTYFADNVGKILETYFFLSNPAYSEKRLIRYQAEKE